jgi:amino acid transporter
MSSGATWIMGADRAQAVACYDGAGPRILGTFSKRYGTPIAVNALSGIISSLFMILAFQLTSGSTAQYFSAALGFAISTTTIAYLAIFPALYLLRRKLPNVHRPYRVPFGNAGALIISVAHVRLGAARNGGAPLAGARPGRIRTLRFRPASPP